MAAKKELKVSAPLPISFKEFAKEPVKGLMFICLVAVGYLYVDGKVNYSNQIEKQGQKIELLETKVDLLTNLILLVGCSSPETNIQNDENQAVDSILEQSQRSFISADSIGRESDSLINRKVSKTVKQITTLQKEVTTLKAENNELKTKLDDAVDAGKPFQLLPVLSNGKNNR